MHIATLRSALVGMVVGGWLATGVVAQSPSPLPARYQARVNDVVDGDTVHLQAVGSRESIKARLLGMDAPEICQAFGADSKAALSRRINQMMVTVESLRQDDYGRALAIIYLNGEEINAWMVQQGFAWSYGARGSKGPYKRDEEQARQMRRGLFANHQAMKPSQFRRKNKACPAHASA